MGRRSTLVAFAAVAAMAFVPVNASAATPALTSTLYASPATFTWTPTAVATEQLFRLAGACPATLAGGAPVASTGGPLAPPSNATDAPGDGVFCYYVQDDGLATGAGLQVTIDTTPPTPGVTVGVSAAPNFVRGAGIVVTPNSTDTATAVTDALHLGGATCDATSPALVSPWDTTTVADGAYTVCDVATDAAGHVAVATFGVVVDNTLPAGTIANPTDGMVISGDATHQFPLTATPSDALSGVHGVIYQRSPNGTTGWVNIGGAAQVVNAATSYLRNFNTTQAADGPEFLRALVFDNAGNQGTTPVVAVTVDNTPPDVAATLSAPPAVAGSPTITWTPAHDNIGIVSYDVLRNGVVIGSVAADQGLAFNDKNAPDQQTSTYTVRAYDGVHTAAHSILSNAVSVLVDSTAQSAPRALTAASPTAAAPVLSWQAPPVFAVNHYDIYRDGVLLASTTTAATSYTDGTAPEGVHDYAVLARGADASAGVLSASFKVTYDLTPPTSGGAPTADVQTNGSVNLIWPAAADALSGVAGYVVRRAAGATPPASAAAGLAVCAPVAPNCVDTGAPTGTSSYSFFARDGAGNVALIGTIGGVVIVDRTPPLAPTKLTVTRTKAKTPTANVTVTLHWVKPTAADLERVVVVLNLQHPPKLPADGRSVYHGLGTSAKVKLKAGDNAYFAIYAYDSAGNVSVKPVRTVVRLAALIPLRPLNGSTIHTGSPLLTWKPFKGTTYYNVQLFVNGKRILVGWPSTASFRIPKGKLMPGTYVWYVWPAIGGKGGAAKFGNLIGRATFKYKT